MSRAKDGRSNLIENEWFLEGPFPERMCQKGQLGKNFPIMVLKILLIKLGNQVLHSRYGWRRVAGNKKQR
jgi:hypothetical protein